jgi:general L-amino acid transport system permease protein
MTDAGSSERHAAVPFWRDVRVLRVAGQVAVMLAVAILIGFLFRNLTSAMAERGLSFEFGFLGQTAGFEVSESPVPYRATDSYGQAFIVGLLNTLFISLLGIVLATILGVAVGVARLSPNWLLSRVATGYVELIRNTPLLVQLFIIYFAVLSQLPTVGNSIVLPGSIFLNQRGLFVPGPQFTASAAPWLVLVAVGVAAAVATWVVANRREANSRPSYHLRTIGLIGFGVVVVVGWIVLPPIRFDVPVLGRFNFTGGLALSSPFTALLVGLVIYTAAFIGEVVRGGIQAVRRGQLEAARALGLSEGQTLRLVIFPQALRVIVPPLTSQYLNLTKNSSLAIAVGYPDLFKIGVTMANQTGQPVSVIALVMGTYLAISLVTSLFMNVYNRRVQVLER